MKRAKFTKKVKALRDTQKRVDAAIQGWVTGCSADANLRFVIRLVPFAAILAGSVGAAETL